MYLILLILLILLVFGGLPQISGSWHNAGYGPSGIVLVVVIIVVVLLVSGRL
jgi:Protein of unknown function (DUF3309)